MDRRLSVRRPFGPLLAACLTACLTGCIEGAAPSPDGCGDCADVGEPAPDGGPSVCADDGAHALRVRAVTLSGRVAIAPAARPAWAGGLRVAATSETGVTYTAEADAAGRYAVMVPVGEYDVIARFTGGGCRGDCPALGLGWGLAVEGDTVVDAALDLVPVAGEVLLDGRQPPPGDRRTGRGALVLTERDTGSRIALPLPDAGPAVFSTALPAGASYSATWVTEVRARPVLGEAARALPLGRAALGEVAPRGAEAGLRLDARSVRVDATIRLDGRPLPDDGIVDGNPRGELMLGDVWIDLGERGARTALRVFPGEVYAVLVPGPEAEQDAVPRGFGGIGCPVETPEGPRSACALWADGPVDLAFASAPPRVERPAVPVSGRARLVAPDGRVRAPVGDCGLRVVLRRGTDWASGEVGADGRFAFDAPPGTYTASLVGTGAVGRCPVGGAAVVEALGVNRPVGGLELEAPVAPARVELRVNGEPMPDDGLLDGDPRGRLSLSAVGDGAGSIALDLGERGPAVFDFEAVVGRHAITLGSVRATRGQIEPAMSQDVLPATERQVGALDVRARGGEAVVDLPVVRARGAVAVDAAVAPAVGAPGWLRLESVGDGHHVWVPLGADGRFDAWLYADRHAMWLGGEYAMAVRVETAGGDTILDLFCE